MKKRILCLGLVLGILMCRNLIAHPPSKIQLDFNTEKKLIKVTVLHDVKDPQRHFIKMVTIQLNNTTIVVQNFLKQVDKEKQEAIYQMIDIKPGDELKATVECNMYGKKTQNLKL